jgi:hypothetical protein
MGVIRILLQQPRVTAVSRRELALLEELIGIRSRRFRSASRTLGYQRENRRGTQHRRTPARTPAVPASANSFRTTHSLSLSVTRVIDDWKLVAAGTRCQWWNLASREIQYRVTYAEPAR